MTINKLSSVLLLLVAVSLITVPTLYFFGCEETKVVLFGKERTVKVPEFGRKSYRDRSFQKAFEENYAKHFFLRKTFLKTKYQLLDWLNLGQFHEGYSHRVLEGRDGTLFESHYVKYHLDKKPINATIKPPSLQTLKAILGICQDNAIDFIVLLAPDKVQIYHEQLPWWTSLFGELSNMNSQSEFAAILKENGIPVFDASSFLLQEKASRTELLFPQNGTHWNALSAALSVEKMFELLNESKAPEDKYRLNRLIDVEHVEAPLYNDTDIGLLLNVWDGSRLRKNVNLSPVYKETRFKPNPGSVAVFGDSFSYQPVKAMQKAGLFGPYKVLKFDKRVPKDDEMSKIASDLRLLVLVFQPPNFYDVWHRHNWDKPLLEFKEQLHKFCNKKVGSKQPSK